MLATTETQNLWLGRSAWMVGLLLAVALGLFLASRARNGRISPVAASLGVAVGAMVFLIIGGSGALFEGLALGVLAGLTVGYVTTLIQQKDT